MRATTICSHSGNCRANDPQCDARVRRFDGGERVGERADLLVGGRKPVERDAEATRIRYLLNRYRWCLELEENDYDQG